MLKNNCTRTNKTTARTVNKKVHRTIKWLKKAKANWTFFFSITVEKTGIKAEDSAPSPKRRRNKLGIVNPTIKAELQALAPNAAKIKTSRSNPVTRDNTVVRLTEATFLRSLLKGMDKVFYNRMNSAKLKQIIYRKNDKARFIR